MIKFSSHIISQLWNAIKVLSAFLPKIRYAQNIQSQLGAAEKLAQEGFCAITVAVPDIETAKRFAAALVKGKFAATVNLFPNAISAYIWDETVRDVSEVLMLIYTHTSQYKNIERYIIENHIHIEPGIVALPIVAGSESFLQWVHDITVTEKRIEPVAKKAMRSRGLAKRNSVLTPLKA